MSDTMQSVPKVGGAGERADPRAKAEPNAASAAKAKPVRAFPTPWFKPSILNAKLIYAGFLVSLAIPFLALVSGYLAYAGRNSDAPSWLRSHYHYQFRTFFIGLLANIVAWVLTLVGVGLLLLPLIAIWVVARSVHGLIRVAQRSPIDNPDSYFV